MIKILKLKLFLPPHNFLILFYYSQSGYAKTSLLIAHSGIAEGFVHQMNLVAIDDSATCDGEQ